jgi:hypothetical protein
MIQNNSSNFSTNTNTITTNTNGNTSGHLNINIPNGTYNDLSTSLTADTNMPSSLTSSEIIPRNVLSEVFQVLKINFKLFHNVFYK